MQSSSDRHRLIINLKKRVPALLVSFALSAALLIPLSRPLALYAGTELSAVADADTLPSGESAPAASAEPLSSDPAALNAALTPLTEAEFQNARQLADQSPLLNPSATASIKGYQQPDFSGLELSSKSVLLSSFRIGDGGFALKTILESGVEEPLDPGSFTQVMLAYLVLKGIDEGRINPDERLFVDWPDLTDLYEMGAPVAGLDYGEQIRVQDLLALMLLANAHDAARVLTQTVAPTYDECLSLMNDRAGKLQMRSTKFADVSGLSNPKATTNLRDLSRLVGACLRYPRFHEILLKREYVTAATNMHESGLTVEALSADGEARALAQAEQEKSPFSGLKSAYDSRNDSMIGLSYREQDGNMFILMNANISVMSRLFADQLEIYDRAFAPIGPVALLRKGALLRNVPAPGVRVGEKDIDFYPLLAPADFIVNANTLSDFSAYRSDFALPEKITAPMEAGSELARLQIRYGAKQTVVYSDILRNEEKILPGSRSVLIGRIKFAAAIVCCLALLAYLSYSVFGYRRKGRSVYADFSEEPDEPESPGDSRG